MSVKDKYAVKPIARYLCKEWCLKKHYAKRLPPIEYAFGLIDEFGITQGIVTYGTPVSSTLRDLWRGRYKLMELNRLVINEGVERNALSYLVGKSLNYLPKPLVVASYADTSQGHHGYIYQATNWIYTGLSAPFKEWKVRGKENMHHSTIHDLSRGQENRLEWLKQKFGDDLIEVERPRKHRYFYFVGSKTDKKVMRKMLPYEVQEYPKGDNARYDASYQTHSQGQLF